MILFFTLFLLQTTDHRDIVAKAKQETIAAGINPDAGPGECGRWEITRRAALALVGEGAGLLDKPSGNNCKGFAVDIIAYHDGTIVDVLGNGREGPNTPLWMVNPNKVDPSRWRAAPMLECVTHPALTNLDRASMVAAFTASFRGLFNREPTGQRGSGSDDIDFWISVSDHFGEFSDHVCRAGWSAYWEAKLAGADSVNPALGDQPARFQPNQPTPEPSPPPPETDVIGQKLDAILRELQALREEERKNTEKIQTQIDTVVKNAERSATPLILKILSLGMAR